MDEHAFWIMTSAEKQLSHLCSSRTKTRGESSRRGLISRCAILNRRACKFPNGVVVKLLSEDFIAQYTIRGG